MPNLRSSLCTYVYFILYVRTRLPSTWWICSNITLEVGSSKAHGLDIIPYSSSIRYFTNSLPINFGPWSYVISVSLGYIVNHVVSTNSAIDINHLFSHRVTSNHPVTWSIMVIDLELNFVFFSFFLWHGDLLYLHIVYSVVSSQLPYLVIYYIFYLNVFTLASVTIILSSRYLI